MRSKGARDPARLIATAARDCPFDIALVLALGDVLTFVGFLLASRDSDQHFGPAANEVHFERHQRDAALTHAVGEFANLAAVSQQCAHARGRMLAMRTGGRVLGNVNAVQRQGWRIGDSVHVAFSKTDLAVADRLDLRSRELDATFERVFDEVVVPCATILDGRFVRIGCAFGGHDDSSCGVKL